ncbi:MAG: 2-phosphoglycerate kinase [Candidatus Paceibacteria bacterium]|jgi:2-phosphoglycerate kinase
MKDDQIKGLDTIARYNRLWSEGKITKPIVILIGGYTGTGKSTLAKFISQFFNCINTLPTGIIRTVHKSIAQGKLDHSLYDHTYNLHKYTKGRSTDVQKMYQKQIAPIAQSINEIVTFACSEKQHWIIEGNHVFPGYMNDVDDVFLFEIYMKVGNVDIHRNLMSGPTHNRKISDIQFLTARNLHDFTVSEALAHNRISVEYNTSPEEIIKLIDKKLSLQVK